MSEQTTDRAPWCPRCGGEMVRTVEAGHGDAVRRYWVASCYGCGFEGDRTHRARVEDARADARRLIRAELARQALEMRAHGRYTMRNKYDGGSVPAWPHSRDVRAIVLSDYDWLGANPLRLPGEGGA